MDALDRLIQLAQLQGTVKQHGSLLSEKTLESQRPPLGEAIYYVVLHGECRLRMRGRSDTVLVEGEIVMLPRGGAHSLITLQSVNIHNNGCAMSSHKEHENVMPGPPQFDLLCGLFTYTPNSLVIEMLPDLVKMTFERNDLAGLATLVAMMRKEASIDGQGARSVVSALSITLFTFLIRQHLASEPVTNNFLTLLTHPRLGPSVFAMLDRPSDKWTIETLAKLSAMSRATYLRAFGALTGDSPMSLLTRIRMQLGATLLSRTKKSIGRIADDVGYQSESAFSKNFKDAYGVGPGLFRQTCN